MIVDTGANVSIIRKDLAQNSQVSIIWTSPCISLQSVTDDKIHVHGKVNITLRFGNIDYHHTACIADITDPCILGLDFLKNNNFKLDFENSNMHSKFKDITLFGLQTQFESNQKIKIIAKPKLSLSLRTECIMPGLVAENRKFRFGLIDYPDPDNSKGEVLIASSVVDLSKSVIPVRVAIISDKTRTIQEGEVIAACAPVTCVDRKCNSQDHSSDDLVKNLLQNIDLDKKQRCAAGELITEFQSIFSRTFEDFGITRLTKHLIDTVEHPPIKQHPRRLPFAKQEEVQNLIKDMKNNDVIEPSSCPWASPIVLVRNKDGSTRFCVDYRRLNDVTKKEIYPLSRIDDSLDTLAGNIWFSTLDLKSGYRQVELQPDDKEKTAFTTGQGLWQFKVMLFGLCNAPGTFERLMESLLGGLSYEACLVYLDDIIIVGRSFEEHLKNIRRVLQKLKEANLKLSPSKRHLFRCEVTYLKHIILAKGVRTDPNKISAVKDRNCSTDVHQLRSFLGLCTKGSAHGNADAYSRRPCPESCKYCSRIEKKFGVIGPIVRQVTTPSTSAYDPWSDESVRKDQLADSKIKPIIEFKESSDEKRSWQEIAPFHPTTKRYWTLWDSLHLKNGLLYRTWESDDEKTFRWQLIHPKTRISTVLKEPHGSPTGGHFGVMKTVQKVRECFYWNNVRSDVEKCCLICDPCAARKDPRKRTRGRLQLHNVGAPFERIAFDILGPLPRSSDDNNNILVVMDYFTKWPETYPIPNQEASTVAEVLVQH
ncbi:retrovirus-related Pol polyprotein from transposon 17.6 [Trichonephila clavipes]|nr:retrovirus-related Pol polyprotein from transposon 17.6 [Trichonephila clavipes]